MNNPRPAGNINIVPLKSTTPPASLELEIEVIGGILLDPNAIARVADVLKAEHFYYSAYQNIYKAAIALYRQNYPVDLMTVFTWLSDRGLIEKIGGQKTLTDALGSIVSAVNIDFYAQDLIKKWNRREIIRVSREIAALALDQSVSDESLQNQSEALLTAVFSASGQQKALRPLSDFIQEEVSKAIDFVDGGVKAGTSTGFYDLDELTYGLRPKKLGVIAGRPGMGKSALLGSIAHNIAKQGKTVAIFSLEMSGGEIAQRLLASIASVNSAKFKMGNFRQEEIVSMCDIAANPIEGVWIDDSADISVAHIRSKVRELQIRQGSIDVIMIDYLHLMLDDGSEENTREIGKITRALKKLAFELDVNIQILSQLNRAVEGRGDKRPTLSDLRASGSIEQDADWVLLLYRDEYYNQESPDRGVAELIVAKNRDGATGTVKLLFEPEYSRFRNLKG